MGYVKAAKNGEYWTTREKFDRMQEKKKAKAREWVEKNKDYCRSASRKSYAKHREKRLSENRAQYRAKREDRLAWNKQWVANNKDRVREYHRDYAKSRRLEDPLFMLTGRCRARVTDAFRRGALGKAGFTKKSKTLDLVGCTWEDLKAHIESLFLDGMTWENRSEWHIDHIKPLASAKSEDDIRRLFHYTNLRPLWKLDNMKKGSKH